MAKSKENVVKISEIRQQMGKSTNYISQYRKRLIDSQVIVEAGYGKVAFSLPFMGEFILQMAELYGMDWWNKFKVDYRMKLATQLVVNKKRHSAWHQVSY